MSTHVEQHKSAERAGTRQVRLLRRPLAWEPISLPGGTLTEAPAAPPSPDPVFTARLPGPHQGHHRDLAGAHAPLARGERACLFSLLAACCTLGVGPLTKPAHHTSRTAALQEKYFMENVSIGERLSTLGASLSSRPSAGPSAAGGQLTRAPSSARHPRQAPRPTSRPPCRSTARSGSTPPLRSSSAVRPYCSALLSPWAVATQY